MSFPTLETKKLKRDQLNLPTKESKGGNLHDKKRKTYIL